VTLKIAITPGEPAGIGPDLVLELAQAPWPVQLVLIADKKVLSERADLLGLNVTLVDYTMTQDALLPQGQVYVLDTPVSEPVIPGQLNVKNGPYVVETLRKAAQLSLENHFHALVTGPVNKGIINKSGMSFSGHTEFFALQANIQQVVMMLATEGLRVALVTTHIPLAYVSKAITIERLTNVIRQLNSELIAKYGIEHPKIYVCGLNPHAGEDGHLGREEIEVISPTLDVLRKEGMNLIGPLPADTIFQEKYLKDADVVLAMYHDQGLPVLKYKGFGQGINVTLGLPFIRTSVDHGTALDLAGTGQAESGSLQNALKEAITLAKHKL
jgi:4-hydroxythreonine-4-phosphate dehydrogenase